MSHDSCMYGTYQQDAVELKPVNAIPVFYWLFILFALYYVFSIFWKVGWFANGVVLIQICMDLVHSYFKATSQMLSKSILIWTFLIFILMLYKFAILMMMMMIVIIIISAVRVMLVSQVGAWAFKKVCGTKCRETLCLILHLISRPMHATAIKIYM